MDDARGRQDVRRQQTRADAHAVIGGVHRPPMRDAAAIGTAVKGEIAIAPLVGIGRRGLGDAYLLWWVVGPERAVAAADGAVAALHFFRRRVEFDPNLAAVAASLNHSNLHKQIGRHF